MDSFIQGNGRLPLISTPLKKNGTATSPQAHGPQPAATAPSSCDSIITPACLQSLYGLPTTAATQASNGIAVAGLLGQYAQQADLTVSWY